MITNNITPILSDNCLQKSVINGDYDTTRQLIRSKKYDINIVDSNHNNLLHLAIENKFFSIALLLCKYGASLLQENRQGDSAYKLVEKLIKNKSKCEESKENQSEGDNDVIYKKIGEYYKDQEGVFLYTIFEDIGSKDEQENKGETNIVKTFSTSFKSRMNTILSGVLMLYDISNFRDEEGNTLLHRVLLNFDTNNDLEIQRILSFIVSSSEKTIFNIKNLKNELPEDILKKSCSNKSNTTEIGPILKAHNNEETSRKKLLEKKHSNLLKKIETAFTGENLENEASGILKEIDNLNENNHWHIDYQCMSEINPKCYTLLQFICYKFKFKFKEDDRSIYIGSIYDDLFEYLVLEILKRDADPKFKSGNQESALEIIFKKISFKDRNNQQISRHSVYLLLKAYSYYTHDEIKQCHPLKWRELLIPTRSEVAQFLSYGRGGTNSTRALEKDQAYQGTMSRLEQIRSDSSYRFISPVKKKDDNISKFEEVRNINYSHNIAKLSAYRENILISLQDVLQKIQTKVFLALNTINAIDLKNNASEEIVLIMKDHPVTETCFKELFGIEKAAGFKLNPSVMKKTLSTKLQKCYRNINIFLTKVNRPWVEEVDKINADKDFDAFLHDPEIYLLVDNYVSLLSENERKKYETLIKGLRVINEENRTADKNMASATKNVNTNAKLLSGFIKKSDIKGKIKSYLDKIKIENKNDRDEGIIRGVRKEIEKSIDIEKASYCKEHETELRNDFYIRSDFLQKIINNMNVEKLTCQKKLIKYVKKDEEFEKSFSSISKDLMSIEYLLSHNRNQNHILELKTEGALIHSEVHESRMPFIIRYFLEKIIHEYKIMHNKNVEKPDQNLTGSIQSLREYINYNLTKDYQDYFNDLLSARIGIKREGQNENKGPLLSPTMNRKKVNSIDFTQWRELIDSECKEIYHNSIYTLIPVNAEAGIINFITNNYEGLNRKNTDEKNATISLIVRKFYGDIYRLINERFEVVGNNINKTLEDLSELKKENLINIANEYKSKTINHIPKYLLRQFVHKKGFFKKRLVDKLSLSLTNELVDAFYNTVDLEQKGYGKYGKDGKDGKVQLRNELNNAFKALSTDILTQLSNDNIILDAHRFNLVKFSNELDTESIKKNDSIKEVTLYYKNHNEKLYLHANIPLREDINDYVKNIPELKDIGLGTVNGFESLSQYEKNELQEKIFSKFRLLSEARVNSILHKAAVITVLYLEKHPNDGANYDKAHEEISKESLFSPIRDTQKYFEVREYILCDIKKYYYALIRNQAQLTDQELKGINADEKDKEIFNSSLRDSNTSESSSSNSSFYLSLSQSLDDEEHHIYNLQLFSLIRIIRDGLEDQGVDSDEFMKTRIRQLRSTISPDELNVLLIIDDIEQIVLSSNPAGDLENLSNDDSIPNLTSTQPSTSSHPITGNNNTLFANTNQSSATVLTTNQNNIKSNNNPS